MVDAKSQAVRWSLKLPPKTQALDLVHTGDRIYLATSEGLLCVADDLEGEPMPPGFVFEARKPWEEESEAERPKKRPKREARKRKTGTVQVPDDEEDGAIVLDEYIDTFVPLLGLDPDGGAMTRYHTITRMFAFALVHPHLLPNGKEG